MKRSPSLSPSLMVAGALALVWAIPAHAYVGPGAGLSLLGALWGLVVAVAAAVGFVLLWPLRRAMRRRRTAASAQPTAPDAQDPAAR